VLARTGSHLFFPLLASSFLVQLPGCVTWLDASDPNSLAVEGTNVIGWMDKSGAGNSFTVAAGLPTSTLTQNGLAVASFNGAALMNSFISTAVAPATTSAFLVARVDSINGTGFGYALACPNIDGGDFSVRYNNNGLIGGISNPGNSNDFANKNYFLNGTATATNSVPASASFAYHIVSASMCMVPGTTPFSLSTSFLDSGVERAFIGEICEVIVYNQPLTTANRQWVEGQLAWKWGLQTLLPSTHPYAPDNYTPPTPAPVGDVSNYLIGYRTPSGNGDFKQWSTGSSATSATLPGLTPSTTYDVQVTASGPGGETPCVGYMTTTTAA
jgi:hypothetical protein